MSLSRRVTSVVGLAAIAGCGGSSPAPGVSPAARISPIPTNGRLLYRGILRSDINLTNFPPGGTGDLYIYDDVTGDLQTVLPARTGSHFDAAQVPPGHAVRVFFVPKAAGS